ncbi:MAG: hypothetical protein R3C32_07685 [Chloroflexota bacterium]
MRSHTDAARAARQSPSTEAMPMTPTLMFLLDLDRHQHPGVRDLLPSAPPQGHGGRAIFGVNIGLLAVTAALSSTDLSMGIGFWAVRGPLDHPAPLVGGGPAGGRVLLRGTCSGCRAAWCSRRSASGRSSWTILVGLWLIDHPRSPARYRVATPHARPRLDRRAGPRGASGAPARRPRPAGQLRRVDLFVEATTNVEVLRAAAHDRAQPSGRPCAVEGGA